MKILNISYALPSKKVTNEGLIEEIVQKNKKHLSARELESLQTKIKKFFKLSGTAIRYHRNKGEKSFDFAVKAGQEAMRKAKVNPKDVDLLIYAGVGRGWVEPATANLFQSELGLTSATCFDVLDACASWVRSMAIAKSFLSQKVYKLVMILNCEFNFKEYVHLEMDNKNLETSFSGLTIGEAATATLLTANESKDDSFFSFKTWGEKHDLCKITLPNASDFCPNGGDGLKPMSFFTLPGELLAFTIKHLVQHFSETPRLVSKVHDLVVGHAVSVATTIKVAKLLKMDPSLFFETHARFGNTVSASLPLALAVAEKEGKLERDMRVLLLMGSAGVSTSVASFTY